MSYQDYLIGQNLAGYRIERLLGRGGMAQVYYAWDTRLNRPTAVKVIDERYRDDPSYADRFVREARLAATLRHPNILPIYYAGEEQGFSFFAMEYIDGMDLGTLLRQYAQSGERIPVQDALHIGKAIAEALDYAHKNGVIHRDVKSSNVLISSDGRVYLADFGLALSAEHGTLGEVFGSPQYIAPEQARSSAGAVPQSDLYSLGVILYEMLAGRLPFSDPSPAALALKHLTQPPPPPSDFNPALRGPVETVLLKALSKEPPQRYQTGKELVEALENALVESNLLQSGVFYPPGPLYSKDVPETQPFLPVELEGLSPTTLTRVRKTAPTEIGRSLSTLPGVELTPEEVLPAGRVEAMPAPRRLSKLAIGCVALVILALVAVFLGMAFARGWRGLLNSFPAVGQSGPGALSSQVSANKTSPVPLYVPTVNGYVTSTPAPSALPTFTPEITATDTPTPVPGYDLVFLLNNSDSMFLVNAGNDPFPLAPLLLIADKGQINGDEWKVDVMQPGDCVGVWKDNRKAKLPDGLKCNLVGEKLERNGPGRIWNSTFEVFYMSKKIANCRIDGNQCQIHIDQ